MLFVLAMMVICIISLMVLCVSIKKENTKLKKTIGDYSAISNHFFKKGNTLLSNDICEMYSTYYLKVLFDEDLHDDIVESNKKGGKTILEEFYRDIYEED